MLNNADEIDVLVVGITVFCVIIIVGLTYHIGWTLSYYANKKGKK
jgi:hypothetical protein